MLTKELILETIQNMPEEEFEDIDVLLERLVMLDKIQTGIEQADRGELITIEELEKEMKHWNDE
jgi:predicted transcriptional regulator